MSIQIQIMSGDVNTRHFPAKEGRPSMDFREQKAAIIRPNDFPLPFTLSLEADQQPYKPGTYELCPSSFEQGKFPGAIQLARRIKLMTPAPAPGK